MYKKSECIYTILYWNWFIINFPIFLSLYIPGKINIIDLLAKDHLKHANPEVREKWGKEQHIVGIHSMFVDMLTEEGITFLHQYQDVVMTPVKKDIHHYHHFISTISYSLII